MPQQLRQKRFLMLIEGRLFIFFLVFAILSYLSLFTGRAAFTFVSVMFAAAIAFGVRKTKPGESFVYPKNVLELPDELLSDMTSVSKDEVDIRTSIACQLEPLRRPQSLPFLLSDTASMEEMEESNNSLSCFSGPLEVYLGHDTLSVSVDREVLKPKRSVPRLTSWNMRRKSTPDTSATGLSTLAPEFLKAQIAEASSPTCASILQGTKGNGKTEKQSKKWFLKAQQSLLQPLGKMKLFRYHGPEGSISRPKTKKSTITQSPSILSSPLSVKHISRHTSIRGLSLSVSPSADSKLHTLKLPPPLKVQVVSLKEAPVSPPGDLSAVGLILLLLVVLFLPLGRTTAFLAASSFCLFVVCGKQLASHGGERRTQGDPDRKNADPDQVFPGLRNLGSPVMAKILHYSNISDPKTQAVLQGLLSRS